MQELWLFGQLKTLEKTDDTKTRMEQDAKEVGELMTQLMAMESTNGHAEATTDSQSDTDPVLKGMEKMLEDET